MAAFIRYVDTVSRLLIIHNIDVRFLMVMLASGNEFLQCHYVLLLLVKSEWLNRLPKLLEFADRGEWSSP